MTDRLIARAGDVNILVVGGDGDRRPQPPAPSEPSAPPDWPNHLFALLVTMAATGVGFLVEAVGLPIANISVAWRRGAGCAPPS